MLQVILYCPATWFLTILLSSFLLFLFAALIMSLCCFLWNPFLSLKQFLPRFNCQWIIKFVPFPLKKLLQLIFYNPTAWFLMIPLSSFLLLFLSFWWCGNHPANQWHMANANGTSWCADVSIQIVLMFVLIHLTLVPACVSIFVITQLVVPVTSLLTNLALTRLKKKTHVPSSVQRPCSHNILHPFRRPCRLLVCLTIHPPKCHPLSSPTRLLIASAMPIAHANHVQSNTIVHKVRLIIHLLRHCPAIIMILVTPLLHCLWLMMTLI